MRRTDQAYRGRLTPGRLAPVMIVAILGGAASAAPVTPAGDAPFRYAVQDKEYTRATLGSGGIALTAQQAPEEVVLQDLAVARGVILNFYCEDPTQNDQAIVLQVDNARFADLIDKVRNKSHDLIYRTADGVIVSGSPEPAWENVTIVDAYPAGCEKTRPLARRMVGRKDYAGFKESGGEVNVAALQTMLAKEGPISRLRVLRVLMAARNPEHLPIAISALADPNPRVVLRAAQATAHLAQNGNATAAAAAIYQTFDQRRFLELVPMLAHLDRERSWQAVQQLIASTEPSARDVAIRTLTIAPDPRAIPWLASIARGGDSAIGNEALLTIARTGGPEATRILGELVNTDDPARQRLALEAIANLPEADRKQMYKVLSDLLKRDKISDDVFAALASSAFAPVMAELLADPAANAKTKTAALKGLIDGGDEKTVDTVAIAIEDKRPEVRRQAVESLHGLAVNESTPHLHKTAKDQDPEIRAISIQALSELFYEPETVEIVIGALNDPDARVRRNAIDGLDLFGKPNDAVIAAWRRAKSSSDPYVAKHAAQRLKDWEIEK